MYTGVRGDTRVDKGVRECTQFYFKALLKTVNTSLGIKPKKFYYIMISGSAALKRPNTFLR